MDSSIVYPWEVALFSRHFNRFMNKYKMKSTKVLNIFTIYHIIKA